MTFLNFFKSYYYEDTYLPPVDLRDPALEKDNPQAEVVQKLVSETVRCASLAGWVIESGACSVSQDRVIHGLTNDRGECTTFTPKDSLLRIAMSERIQRIAQKADIDVVLPKTKLVICRDMPNEKDATKKYVVLCEKLDILSKEETVQAIKNMNEQGQKDIAKTIVKIVQKSGFVDASFHNIRLTKHSQRLAFIDTKPVGLMISKEYSSFWRSARGASVEKCARIGLYTLMSLTSSESGLTYFHQEVKQAYEKVATPKLSKWKITLSILSLGIIPLINAICSLMRMLLLNEYYQAFEEQNKLINTANRGYCLAPARDRVVNRAKTNMCVLIRRMCSVKEGVVLSAPVPT